MKLLKTFFKLAAPVIVLMLSVQFTGLAQTVTYTANNTATATGNVGTTALTDISNNGPTVTRLLGDVTPVNFPMIGLAKTAAAPVIQTDGSYNIVYTFKVQNYGAIDLNSIQVADDLTAAFGTPMTFTKVTLTSSAVTAGSVLTVNGSYDGNLNKNLLTAASSNLKVGASGTLTLTINVVPNATYGTFNNTATATGVTANADLITVTDISTNNASPNQANAAKTPLDFNVPTPVTILAPDLLVTKTVDVPLQNTGGNVVFTITVKNKASVGDAAPVVVNDVLPAGFSYVSSSTATGTYTSGTGVWAVGTIASGSTKTLTITAKVLANDNTASDFKNIATAPYTGDLTPSDNTDFAIVTPTPATDLAVSITDGIGTYTPGSTTTYTVVLTNNGPTNVTGATVTNPMPTGTTGTWSVTGHTGTVSTPVTSGSGDISQTVDMASGSTITYTVVVTIPSGRTGSLLSTATVAVPVGVTDTNTGNNTNSDNDTQSSSVDVRITNTDSKLTYVPGTANAYTVTVTNNGPSDVTGATITDPLPAGTGSWTVSYPTGTSGTGSGTVTGAISDVVSIASGKSITYTYTVNVPSSTTGTFTTTATVATPGFTNNAPLANQSAVDNDTQSSSVDVRITNTDSKLTYVPGTANAYTVTVTNNGPSDVTGATITDPLPAGTGSWTVSYPTGTSGTGSGTVTGAISDVVSIASGKSITYTYTVNVPSSTTGTFTTTATVATPGFTNNAPLANQSAVDNDTQSSSVDVRITNTDSKLTYVPGTANAYTVTVTNNGPSDVTGATITDPLPAGTGSWTVSYPTGTSGTGSGTVTGAISDVVSIASGKSITYTYTVNVPSSTTGTFTTTATVATPGFTNNAPLANQSAVDNDTQSSSVDVRITNTDSKLTYVPGTANAYTVTVANNGPSDVTGATITDPLPAGTGSWTVSYPTGTSGTGSGTVTGAISDVVSIASGKSITYTYTVNVPSSTTGTFTTTATVATPGFTNNAPLANQSAVDNDTSNPQPDLVLTNTDGVSVYTAGTSTTYIVTINNVGSSDATAQTVTDNLPANATWTAAVSGNATIPAALGTGSINQTTVNIPAGGKIIYTIIVPIPSSTIGNVVNTASVTVPTGDGTPLNNTQTDTDTPSPKADLAVAKTVNNATPQAGANVTFTIVATNNGPSDATGVNVTDLLKTGYTYVSNTTTVGTYVNSTGIWTIGNLIKGATATLTVTAKVNANIVVPNYDNAATITGNEPDPVSSNNTATVNTIVPVPIIDLAIGQTVSTTTPNVNGNVTFTLTVNNNGPSDGTGVVVADPLPAGYTYVSSNPAVGTYNPITGTWTIGNLANGGSTTLTITAVVNANNPATNYINTATVSGTQTEPNLTNNIATVNTVVPVPITDLAVTKTVSNAAPQAGSNVTFTITALNNGPSNATGAKVTDLLKAGYTFVRASTATGAYVSSTGVWTIGSLATGASATLTVVAKVNANILPPGYDNVAVISGNETDPVSGNNTATVTTVPVPYIDLAINQTVSSSTPDVNGNVTFTLTVNNNGPSSATGVSVADLLKAGFTIVSNNPAVGTYNPTTGVWTIGNLANGASTTLTIVAKVNNAGTSVVVNDYTNTAIVSGNEQEVTLLNNTSIQVVSKPPLANDDNAVTNPNTPVTIPILNNDTKGGANLDPSKVTIIQQPAHGTLSIDPLTGNVIYTPATNYFGPDVFTYTVKDINGATSNVATVNIKINDQPTIGLAKTLVSSVKAVDGSFDITYWLTVGNYGIPDLSNISIKDDMSQTFSGEVVTLKSITSLGSLVVNPAYNGTSVTEMLQTGNVLLRGQIQQIQVTVNVRLLTSGKTYLNSATASGTSVTGLIATDVSTDGLKPDPNTPGDVSPSVPTPVQLSKPKEFIPGGFSPNNDGMNDKFVIENSGTRHMVLEVFNRWGNLVYKSGDYKNDWDGKCNQGLHVGDDVPVGTYFYIVSFDSTDRREGYITISR